MKATELIQKLAQAIAMVGDHEVVLEIQDHDGFDASNVRSGAASFVTDTTYSNLPFRIVSRTQIAPKGNDGAA